MNYIIKRKERKEIEKIKGWLLIYGRRKVGKTFLVRNFLKQDSYFLVKRSLSIVNEKEYAYAEFLEKVKEVVERDKVVAIDEFQRLPSDFLDELARLHPKGKVVLLGSSLGIARKIFARRSPLLGLISEYKLGLFRPAEIFSFISKKISPGFAFEASPFFVEPWILKYLKKESAEKLAFEIVQLNKNAIKALIGEIFSEEEKELTARYEAILRMLALGRWRAKEIAGILFNRHIIDRADVGLIKAYLKNMEKMDLVESIKIINSREKYFRIKSPLIDLYYMLSEKYNIDEYEIGFESVKANLRAKLGRYVERFVADVMAEMYRGRIFFYLDPSKEIDIIIRRNGKIVAVGEVKIKATDSDVKRFYHNVSSFGAEKIFISKNKVRDFADIKTISAGEILNL